MGKKEKLHFVGVLSGLFWYLLSIRTSKHQMIGQLLIFRIVAGLGNKKLTDPAIILKMSN